MAFAQKSMFHATEKGEEKEKSCFLSPHQNDPKVGEQIKRYPFGFREKSMSRSLTTGLARASVEGTAAGGRLLLHSTSQGPRF